MFGGLWRQLAGRRCTPGWRFDIDSTYNGRCMYTTEDGTRCAYQDPHRGRHDRPDRARPGPGRALWRGWAR